MSDYDFTRLESESMVSASDGLGAKRVIPITGLVPNSYDYISIAYNAGSNPTTVIYKKGGVSGETIATLTLGYSGDNVISITKV